MGKHEGNCHICGRNTVLTYEHVPPKGALNYMPVKKFSGVDIISHQKTKLKYQNQQQGSGGYTLCSECNNNTGSYYAEHYNKFVTSLYQLLNEEYSDYKNHKPRVDGFYSKINLISQKVNPLAIFKQIISMFCSTSRFNTYQNEFREFLLNKDSTTFNNNRWKVCIYINTSTRCGSTGLMNVNFGFNVAEIITLPLGIILYDMESHDNIESYLFGCNITDFSKVSYSDEYYMSLELPFNNGAIFAPGFK